jgi:hypothetical protein
MELHWCKTVNYLKIPPFFREHVNVLARSAQSVGDAFNWPPKFKDERHLPDRLISYLPITFLDIPSRRHWRHEVLQERIEFKDLPWESERNLYQDEPPSRSPNYVGPLDSRREMFYPTLQEFHLVIKINYMRYSALYTEQHIYNMLERSHDIFCGPTKNTKICLRGGGALSLVIPPVIVLPNPNVVSYSYTRGTREFTWCVLSWKKEATS